MHTYMVIKFPWGILGVWAKGEKDEVWDED